MVNGTVKLLDIFDIKQLPDDAIPYSIYFINLVIGLFTPFETFLQKFII